MAERIEVESGERLPISRAPGGPRWGRRILTLLIAFAAIGGFAMVVVQSYDSGDEPATTEKAPVITAQKGPTKMRPETPGGMSVPNQDKRVYGQIDSARMPEMVERLLPPPEPLAVAPPAPPAADRDGVSAARELAAVAPSAGRAEAPSSPAAAPEAQTSQESTKLAATPPPSKAVAPVPQSKAVMPAAPARAPEPAAPRQAATAKDRPQPKPADSLASAFRIQIASLRTEQAAKAAWGKLTKDNGDLFGKLRHQIVRADIAGKGTFYRLQAGPLSGEPEAKALCSRVKQRKIGCLVVRP